MQTNPFQNPQRRERIFNLAELRRPGGNSTAASRIAETGTPADPEELPGDSSNSTVNVP